MFRLGFVTLALIATPFRLLCAQDAAQEIRCNYDHRHFCQRIGCISGPSEGGEYLLIPDPRVLQLAGALHSRGDDVQVQLRRCNARSCDVVDVRVSQSDAFLKVRSIDGSGWIFKFATRTWGPHYEAGQFVEVNTSYLDALISYGSCPWDID